MSFICSADTDEATLHKTTHPVARKPHVCGECGYIINPGEVYEKFTVLMDGEFYRYTTCERCADLMEAFAARGFCTHPGYFFHDYADWIDGEPPVKLDENGDPVRGGEIADAIKLKHKTWSAGND